jgi:hypothetical protein
MVVSPVLPSTRLHSSLSTPIPRCRALSFSREILVNIAYVRTPSDSKPYLISICVNAEAFIRLTDPGWIDLFWCFLHPRSSKSLVHDETTPLCPFVGMLAFIMQDLSSIMDILRCRRLNPLGSMDLPSARLFFFYLFHKLSRSTKWCCLGSRACFRFHCHPDSSSCILISLH